MVQEASSNSSVGKQGRGNKTGAGDDLGHKCHYYINIKLKTGSRSEVTKKTYFIRMMLLNG